MAKLKNKNINYWLWPVLRVAVVLAVVSISAIYQFSQPTFATNNPLIGQEQAIIIRTNQIREQAGLPPFAQDNRLMASASHKAIDMASRGYFDHGNQDGYRMTYWINSANYTYSLAGENLAKGFSSLDRLMNAWVTSPSHYKNLVETKFTDIGVGMAEGWYENQNTLFIVQHFGVPVTYTIQNIAKLTASLVFPATPLIESVAGTSERQTIINTSPMLNRPISETFNTDSVPSIPAVVSHPLIAAAQAQSIGSEPSTAPNPSSGAVPFWLIFALIGLALIGYLDEYMPLWVGRIRPTFTR